jgi:hypothetical protein
VRQAHAPHFWRFRKLRPLGCLSALELWHYALAAVKLDIGNLRHQRSWRQIRESTWLERGYESYLEAQKLLQGEPPPAERAPAAAASTESSRLTSEPFAAAGERFTVSELSEAQLGDLAGSPLVETAALHRLDVSTLHQIRSRVRQPRDPAPSQARAAAPSAAGARTESRPLELSLALKLSLAGAEVALHTSAWDEIILEVGTMAADIRSYVATVAGRPPQLQVNGGFSISSALVCHRYCPPQADPSTVRLLFQPGARPGDALSLHKPNAVPQWQLTACIDSGSEDVPMRVGAAFCSTMPLTCCVDWAVLRKLALLAARLSPAAPAPFADEAEGLTPEIAAPIQAAAPALPARNKAKTQFSLQLDVGAPTVLLATCLDEPTLSVPLVHLTRIHVHVSPETTTQGATSSTRASAPARVFWARVGVSVSIAPQHLLLPLLRPRYTSFSSSSRSGSPRVSARERAESTESGFGTPRAHLDLSDEVRPEHSDESRRPSPRSRFHSASSAEVSNVTFANSAAQVPLAIRSHSSDSSTSSPPRVRRRSESASSPSERPRTVSASLGGALERLNVGATRTLERALKLVSPRGRSSSRFAPSPAHEALLQGLRLQNRDSRPSPTPSHVEHELHSLTYSSTSDGSSTYLSCARAPQCRMSCSGIASHRSLCDSPRQDRG